MDFSPLVSEVRRYFREHGLTEEHSRFVGSIYAMHPRLWDVVDAFKAYREKQRHWEREEQERKQREWEQKPLEEKLPALFDRILRGNDR